jgi:phosphoglycolate phosphatase-like HAD superfamily hydrolase
MSWFEHFWGKYPLHTILFDFDDTIFYTTDAQAEAWAESLQAVIIDGIVDISQFNDEQLFHNLHFGKPNCMRDVFLQQQEEKKIFEYVFKEGSLSNRQIDLIRATRLALRKDKTLAASQPIAEISQHLTHLRDEYQLIIVSSTSEEFIKPVLDKFGLNFFSYVFGKEVRHDWTATESKTPIFVRVSSMTGVPLSRMCFVGDSDADFRAARQLGLNFIENRINAHDCGYESLIYSRDVGDHDVVVDRSAGRGLLAAIDRVRERLLSS